MKKLFALLCLGMAFVSCSGDDSNTNNNNNSTTDFLPLDNGNYWVYDVDSEYIDGRDSLYVANDTTINNKNYKKFKTRELAGGFYSGALSNNGVRKDGDKLLLSGTALFNFSSEFPLSFTVSDFTIFKENASADTQLSSVTGIIQQVYEGFPIDFNYELTTTAKGDFETYSVNGQVYNNIKIVETKLNVSAMVDFEGFPVPLMDAQDVIISTQYYAENIGVVHVVTDFSYELNNTFNIEMPIPQTGAEHREEVLVSYSVAEQ